MATFPPTFKVALIQLHPKPLEPETNFQTASQYIKEAAAAGASLAVLPEYHLTGWAPDNPRFAEIASTANSYVPRYQQLAREHKINLVPGTIVQTAAPSDTSSSSTNGTTNGTTKSTPILLNTAPFISYTGELLGTYTKRNLWHPERPHLTSPPHLNRDPTSHPHTIIETPLGPLGILVCWDLAFPEAFRSLVRQGAKLIVIPTFWMRTDASEECLAYNADAERLFLESTLTARAFEGTVGVVFVNAGGAREEGYLGLSRVCMPLVGCVKGSFGDGGKEGGGEGNEEGMRVVEVDMGILEAAERNYKVREDLARDDWHYGYSHEK